MIRPLLFASFIAVTLLAVSSAVRAAEGEAPAGFRAGAATSNITPPLGISINGGMSDRRATHIHDELHARCLVLDDGKTKLAFAVVDSCMIPREVIDEAKAIVEQRTQIPPSHVLISATHTHEAPTAAAVFQSEPDPAYLKFLAVRIADGIQRAANNLAPAKVGWGVGEAPDQVFNRRWRMKEGTVLTDPFGRTDKVKTNPGFGPDLVEPAGPIDPQVWVLSVISPEGRPIAVLANYSLHYVGGEGPGHVSADYFGRFADRMAELLKADRQDPPFVAMMSNGTSGDINNVNFRKPYEPKPPYAQMRHVANAVAEVAARAIEKIEHRDDITLDAKVASLTLGVRKPPAEDIEQAKRYLAAHDTPVQVTLEGIYAKETLALADYPDQVDLIVQAMRIGDLAITAIPCETFVEIGLELKEKSPIKSTFTISLANGYNGYLPTPEHHELGGYETWRAKSSYLEAGASPKVVSKLVELLDAMK